MPLSAASLPDPSTCTDARAKAWSSSAHESASRRFRSSRSISQSCRASSSWRWRVAASASAVVSRRPWCSSASRADSAQAFACSRSAVAILSCSRACSRSAAMSTTLRSAISTRLRRPASSTAALSVDSPASSTWASPAPERGRRLSAASRRYGVGVSARSRRWCGDPGSDAPARRKHQSWRLTRSTTQVRPQSARTPRYIRAPSTGSPSSSLICVPMVRKLPCRSNDPMLPS